MEAADIAAASIFQLAQYKAPEEAYKEPVETINLKGL